MTAPELAAIAAPFTGDERDRAALELHRSEGGMALFDLDSSLRLWLERPTSPVFVASLRLARAVAAMVREPGELELAIWRVGEGDRDANPAGARLDLAGIRHRIAGDVQRARLHADTDGPDAEFWRARLVMLTGDLARADGALGGAS